MKKKVLIFPAGTEIGLEIQKSLQFDKTIELLGVSTVPNHAKYVFKNYIEGLGTVYDPNFLKDLNKIIIENNVDYVFPASDDVAVFLAENTGRVPAIVIGSNEVTSQIARSKCNTYNFFKEYEFIPKVYSKIDEISEYPVFCKPDKGAGSKGAFIAKNEREIRNRLTDKLEDYVITEYLPGKEYTVDCFTDKSGSLLFSGMRERIRIKNGISVNSLTQDTDEKIEQIAEIINSKLEFRGGWFFQVKEDENGNYKLMEIATRIAGTMGLYRAQGVNIPQLAINDFSGSTVKVISNKVQVEIDRALSNKYCLSMKYQTVAIDFDDTITFNGKVNPFVMQYLYQEKNKCKTIVLITRHKYNLSTTLEKLCISEKLFDQIYHLKENERKSDIVKNLLSPIFIDDSFGERKNVSDNVGCPTFDINSVEALIDYRR